ncbi:hypothetical protein [Endozoicomonas ascidiicola]|uniref:hypothetical protein n=1 Tax=Endozoicomonas ascidiicola TaxID=1698521 RepID=UPI00082C65DA|nr:hypothetical protein [Endozoicomonas ascidiicola]
MPASIQNSASPQPAAHSSQLGKSEEATAFHRKLAKVPNWVVKLKGSTFNSGTTEPLSICRKALDTILAMKIQVANKITNPEIENPKLREKKLQLCCEVLVAECQQNHERKRPYNFSESSFNEYCEIPLRTHGMTCDMAAALTYRELLQDDRITPFLIGFRHPVLSHVAVALCDTKVHPDSGIYTLQEPIGKTIPGFWIIDPWFGFACPAVHYGHFVKTACEYMLKSNEKVISTDSGQVDLLTIPNFTLEPRAVELIHLPTLWQENH